MRLPQWTGYGVALGAMLLIGCSANMAGTSPAQVKTSGKISLFDNPHGYGSLQMRIIDQRRGYGVQAIEQAEPYDEVQIRLNGSKIPNARFATMSADPSHQYQSDVLGMLPPGSDYNLIVSLASRSVSLNSLLVVGQGAAEGIEVLPGTSRSVTVLINTVGDIVLLGDNYEVSSGSPELSENHLGLGFPEVLSNSHVAILPYFPDDSDMPESQRINRVRFQLTDNEGFILSDADGNPLASSSHFVNLFDEGGFPEFKVPLISSNEQVAWLTLFGLHVEPGTQEQGERETVIGSKTRGLLMLKGATLSVEVSP